MKHWTIGRRIITGGTILIALLIILGGVAISALSRLETFAGSRLRDDAVPGAIYAAQIMSQSLRGYNSILMAGAAIDPVKRNEYIVMADTNILNATKAIENYENTITIAEDRQNFEELKQARIAFRTVQDGYLQLVKEGKAADAAIFAEQKMNPLYRTLRAKTDVVLDWNEAILTNVTGAMVATAHNAMVTATEVTGVSLIIAVVLGWIIIRGTNRTLQQVTGTLDDAAVQVASAAGQVSASSQALAEGSSEQAASLEETSSSLEELSSMTKRNADGAASAKTLSSDTRTAAESGDHDMKEMREAMDAIKRSSNDISKIIKTIDEIAFQTNILALNAAVEAARAGEAGAGFAVVADEVRALAQRSASSAKETAAKIEVAVQSGERGASISEKVARSLGVILEKARKVDELVAEIATASVEQSQGIGQINTAVSQMDKVTQSNAASAEETAAAAEQLSAQSACLKDTVGELRRLVGGTDSTPSVTNESQDQTDVHPSRMGVSKNISPSRPKPSPKKQTPEPDFRTVGQHDEFFKDA